MINSLLKNIFFVLFAALLAFSCSDDDEGEGNSASIVGSWTYQSADLSITVDGTDFIDYLVSSLGIAEDAAQDVLDATEVAFNGFEGFDISFADDGTYDVTIEGDSEGGTWSLNDEGSVLTLDAGTSDAAILDVITLNESTFSFGTSEVEEEDLDNDGVAEELEIGFVVNLTR